MAEKVVIGNAELWCGDCRDVLSLLITDVVVTDPPYPDYYTTEYAYEDGLLESIGIKSGFVFWSSKANFPICYSAIHIWDKKTGAGSEYERIFEINGKKNYKVFRHYLINSTVAANYGGDVFYGHPSQKPIRLMREIVSRTSGIVFDPFMGSGTTGVACMNLGRRFIGIELDRKYFDIACERIERAQAQGRMEFEEPAKTPEQGDLLLMGMA